MTSKSIEYRYSKIRNQFGRQPLFQVVPAHIVDTILPDKQDQKQYGLRNPVNREIQATLPQSANETNTKQLITHEQGMNHTEGGWPKEVQIIHEESVERHCRRVKHEENYINTVLNLSPAMQHYINQNNAIEMYQTYFAGMKRQEPVETYNVRVANIFRDPAKSNVSCIKWTYDTIPKLAVAYNYNTYPSSCEERLLHTCSIWDLHVESDPVAEMHAYCPCWRLACSPIDPEIFLGGFENGTVSVFDIRADTEPVSNSSVYNSHRGPITGLLYTNTRSNKEFFTGSIDGQCFWWDMRDLSKPTESIPMSVRLASKQTPNSANTEGLSCLGYESGVPNKFLAGTESGLVIGGNRTGKTHNEKLCAYWHAHDGPVRKVQSSPCTYRMFLTCGDWAVRVWSEEVRTSPIIVTKPYRHEVTDAAWAPLRFSSYMSVCAGGVFYYWDFLRKYKEPVATLQVSKHSLKVVTPSLHGEFVAIGDDHGSVFLLHLPENMVLPSDKNKVLMSQTYERETRREHILEARKREFLLKKRTEEEECAKSLDMDSFNEEEEIERSTTEKYFDIINAQLKQMVDSLEPSELSFA